uniref:NADH-ubiquinone oxidoreductase chain 5 n=1 Tax=Heterometrus longimanus TaxID=1719223 RepID=A0A0U2NWL2_9SCOR|nr:NADH dehydrogenase subunit 5 [Heterometrus longimanus]
MNLYKSWSNLLLYLSLTLLLLNFFMMMSEQALILQFNMIQIKSCKLEMFIIMDWVALTFSSAVLLISSMVIKFSDEYMAEEPFKTRFLHLIILFILSMLLLIMSPNMMSILLGWDGLGLVSYCLVIYYQNPRSYNAGMLTVLSNRIGDVMILISIALLITGGTWNIITLNMSKLSMMIMIMITIAAMTKSAQIPFSAWLPAAMAAPTPVSALVHSSTLVTAGVFLLIRFHNMFLTKKVAYFLLISSILTMFMAGIAATLETDMKKIIALSTLSQLGLMMMTLSLNMWILAYFHMITHAMFKALLFLCAGFVIHNTKNNQDIRKMGSITLPSPMISTAMLISSSALMGFPFLAGFYSKDLILEQALKSTFLMFLMAMMLISFGMTMAYSIRLPLLSLLYIPQLPKSTLIHETPMMKSSIFTLSLMATLTGAMLSWLILPSPSFNLIPLIFKSMGIILILLGILLSSSLWMLNSDLFSTKIKMKTFLSSMWFMPILSTTLFSKNLTMMEPFKQTESGWTELIGAQGIHHGTSLLSSKISMIQKNQIQLFMLSFIILLPMILLT